MTWKWEYVFGAEQAARSAPAYFLAEVQKKADELVRAAESLHVHGRVHTGMGPKGGDLIVRGGMFRYQVVVRHERVCVIQITFLGF